MNTRNKVRNPMDLYYRMFPNGKGLREITFQVTEDCNLKCSYCYQINKTPNKMSFITAKRTVDLILEDTNDYFCKEVCDGVVLAFIGGEPLLEITLIDKICEYFLKRCVELHHPWLYSYQLHMSSNGTLYMSDEVQLFLKKYKGHASISITLDGCKELHDKCRLFHDNRPSYDIVEEAVKHAIKHHNQRGSKVTLSPDNVEYVYDAFINLCELGIDNVFMNCIYESGWNVDHARVLYKELKKVADYMLLHDININFTMFDERAFRALDSSNNQNWCGGTGKMLAIDWQGKFYPCLRYMPTSLPTNVKPMTIGSLDDGLVKTKKDMLQVESLKEITRRSQSTDECYNCPIAAGCSWCSANNYGETGTPNKRVTHICIMHKARALANVYFWNNYYSKNNINKVFQNNCLDSWAIDIIGEDELKTLKDVIKKNEQRSNNCTGNDCLKS